MSRALIGWELIMWLPLNEAGVFLPFHLLCSRRHWCSSFNTLYQSLVWIFFQRAEVSLCCFGYRWDDRWQSYMLECLDTWHRQSESSCGATGAFSALWEVWFFGSWEWWLVRSRPSVTGATSPCYALRLSPSDPEPINIHLHSYFSSGWLVVCCICMWKK